MPYTEDGSILTFEEALTNLLNKYSKENGSDTPDFILARYMQDCLDSFNSAVLARESFYGIGREDIHISFGPLDE